MSRLLSTVIAAAFVYFLGGCGARADMKKAEAAVDAFHAQLNIGSFDDIHNHSDDLMKNATSQEHFVNLLGRRTPQARKREIRRPEGVLPELWQSMRDCPPYLLHAI